MDDPTPEDVRAQLVRLYRYRRFRGVKLRGLLGLLIEEWLSDRGTRLTEKFIGKVLNDEPLTYEPDTGKYGYPKTRANLGHVRGRLKKYYETDGYTDPVIVKLNPGSYVPVVAYNPVAASTLDLDPHVERIVLRAKTAIDARTLRGAWRAMHYYDQIPVALDNPRQAANVLFLPLAAASIVPSMAASVRPFAETALAAIRASGFEPWECTFAEACCEACYHHRWQRSLDLFGLAVANSQGEAAYYWWYTALLAAQGRSLEAIAILDSAVRHFSRTNIATRTDLALLQIMAGRFDDAEETLSASLEFTVGENPLLVCSFAMLYEAQDRLMDAARSLVEWFERPGSANQDTRAPDEFVRRRDGHALLHGMFALIAGRSGATSVASECVDILLQNRAVHSMASSLEIALGLIGVGRFDDAVDRLRRAAFEESEPLVMWFHILPSLRHLNGHRGFQGLLRELDLPLEKVR